MDEQEPTEKTRFANQKKTEDKDLTWSTVHLLCGLNRSILAKRSNADKQTR